MTARPALSVKGARDGERQYITEVELRMVREMIHDGQDVPAGLAGFLLRDRDEWVERALREVRDARAQ